jgi:hypothetical protein
MSATSKPLRPDRPIAAYERAAATIAVAGGALWATSLLTLHVVEPEFDPTWRFVSEYALGGAGWLLTIAFVATLPYDGQFGPGVCAGFVGRLLHLSYVGWTITVAHAVIRSTVAATRAQSTAAREHKFAGPLDM